MTPNGVDFSFLFFPCLQKSGICTMPGHWPCFAYASQASALCQVKDMFMPRDVQFVQLRAVASCECQLSA